MPVQLRTLESLNNNTLSTLKSARSNIDISPNTINTDIVTSINNGIFAFNNVLYLAYINQFLDDIDTRIANGTMDSAQLDSLGSNYSLTRHGPVLASGFVYLIFGNIPTSDFTVDIGEVVGTQDFSQSKVLRYVTIQSVTFSIANLESYFVQDLSAYAIQIQIIAESPGSIYNRPPGAIVQLFSTIPNISSVTNLDSITGGEDSESDQDFANRIRQVANQPLGFSQLGGIASFLLKQPGITNVIVLRQRDPEVVRSGGNGIVDVYIRDLTERSATDVVTYDGSTNIFVLSNQPVFQVNTISTLTKSLTLNVDYQVIFDIGNPLSGSPNASTYIQILGSVNPGDQLTFSYIYNINPGFYTNFFATGDNQIEGRNLLCFEGIEVPMFFAINVTRLPEFLPSVIASVVQQNIFDYIANNSLLGETITEASLIGLVINTSGVSNIDLNSIQMRKLSDPIGTREDIVVDRTQYVTIDFPNIVITVTN